MCVRGNVWVRGYSFYVGFVFWSLSKTVPAECNSQKRVSYRPTSHGVWVFVETCVFVCVLAEIISVCSPTSYGVATISRLLTIIGLFCKRALLKSRFSAKETYNLKEPTNCSHPISQSGDVTPNNDCVFECLRVCVCVRGGGFISKIVIISQSGDVASKNVSPASSHIHALSKHTQILFQRAHTRTAARLQQSNQCLCLCVCAWGD